MRATMANDYASDAFAAFERMRLETNKYIRDIETDKGRRPALSGLPDLARRISRAARRWRRARRDSCLSAPVSCLVLYAPSRTPKRPNENSVEFLKRVGRTNRPRTLAEICGIRGAEDILCLEVHAGLDLGASTAESHTVLDFVLATLDWRHVAGLLALGLRTALRRRSLRRTTAVKILEILASRLHERPIKLLLLTSNSSLVELLRLAALSGAGAQTIEVLHGIASTGMESYYDFIEEHARGELIYINLISGLAQFESIRRHMLRDETGEISANCQLWSGLSNDGRTILLPRDLAAEPPVVIVGGTSAHPDYFGSRFFASEAKLISILRSLCPHAPIIYCPHPANAKRTLQLNGLAGEMNFRISDRPTLEMLFVAQAVFGTYSTSLFEAALIGKPVFLLPFDHGMMIPDLLQLTYNCNSLDTLDVDVRRFLDMRGGDKDVSFERTREKVREKLGLTLELSE